MVDKAVNVFPYMVVWGRENIYIENTLNSHPINMCNAIVAAMKIDTVYCDPSDFCIDGASGGGRCEHFVLQSGRAGAISG